ncbi:hypothetical protein KIL84_014604 [Mauremys mutica]|uniref:Uncharacterized protein n=1 Tax=Mauremys mutica TaxID=74926 RepID=A0A9D4B7C3_9SAUR|nr:hypothetical protein KIL84_014604 [Mauremys mutica]
MGGSKGLGHKGKQRVQQVKWNQKIPRCKRQQAQGVFTFPSHKPEPPTPSADPTIGRGRMLSLNKMQAKPSWASNSVTEMLPGGAQCLWCCQLPQGTEPHPTASREVIHTQLPQHRGLAVLELAPGGFSLQFPSADSTLQPQERLLMMDPQV